VIAGALERSDIPLRQQLASQALILNVHVVP
jgi:hypothetical protein